MDVRLLLTDRQRGAIASLAKELTCPVCNDFLEHPHSLRCGHTFCQYCVQEAFRGKMACPECNLPAWGNDLRPSPLFGNLVEKFRDLKEAAGDMISQNVADDEEDEGAEEGQDNRRSSGNGIDAANSSITDDDINGDDDRDRYNNNDSDDKENEMQFEHVQGKRAPFAAGEQRGQREAPAEEGEEEGEEEGQMLIEEEGGEEVFRPTQEIVSDSKELIASRQNLLDRFDDSNLAHAPRDGPHKEVGVSESNNATVSAASHSRQLGTGQKTRGNSHDNIDGVEDSKSRRIQKRRRRESGGEAEEGDSGAHPGPAFSGSPLEQTSSTTSQSSRRAEKIFLVGTSLSKASRKALRKLKGITTRQVAGKEDEVAGGKVETEAEEQGQERSVRVVVKKAVDARTTHLVARAVEGDRCKRTIKFFLAMAFGCRIVSSEWINACHEAKAVVPEESYYIKCGVNDQASCNGPCRARQLRAQGKRLLENYLFTIPTMAEFPLIGVPNMTEILEAAGATVIRGVPGSFKTPLVRNVENFTLKFVLVGPSSSSSSSSPSSSSSSSSGGGDSTMNAEWKKIALSEILHHISHYSDVASLQRCPSWKG